MRHHEIISEYSNFHPDIKKLMLEKGYTYVGSGMDQLVFLDHDGTVLKIFGYSDRSKGHNLAATFIEFCKHNKNNPFLPKFSGLSPFEYDGQKYLQIRQEKLFSTELGDFIESIGSRIMMLYSADTDRIIAKDLSEEWKKEASQINAAFGRDGVLELTETLRQLVNVGEHHGYNWDLHAENIMERANGTPIIVDPWN